MRITLKFSGNIYNLMRQAGYHPHETGEEKAGELSLVRRLSSSDYPRFHAYVHPVKSREAGISQEAKLFNRVNVLYKILDQKIEINLHLDQKKPIYKGVKAHSGEYDGELVEKEAERIKKIAEGP